MNDFYEDDEPLEDVIAAFEASEKGLTSPLRCNNNGGQGIGAGHVCYCNGTAGHPLDSDRPHGCGCGAVW